jgi:hypothetical protein
MSQAARAWQDDRVPKVSPLRHGPRVLAVAVGLVAVGLLAGGCVRVHAALAVSSSDLVSGDVVIASVPTAQSAKGPQLNIPSGMASRITDKPYSAAGYLGSEVMFKDLTFDETTALAAAISIDNAAYHISFARSGDLVTMAGSVDLSQLPPSGVDVQLKVVFPGPVTNQSGGTLTDQTISWVMQPGKVTAFNATDQYALGNSRGWRFWALSLGGGIALISAFLVLLALLARRRNLKKERAYLASRDPATA